MSDDNRQMWLRIKELLDEKAAGRKIIGSCCVFVPEEITWPPMPPWSACD